MEYGSHSRASWGKLLGIPAAASCLFAIVMWGIALVICVTFLIWRLVQCPVGDAGKDCGERESLTVRPYITAILWIGTVAIALFGMPFAIYFLYCLIMELAECAKSCLVRGCRPSIESVGYAVTRSDEVTAT